MKLLIRRRRRNKTKGPKVESRVGNWRDFRIERLEKKTALLSQRKWVFMAIAIIVVAVAVVVMKIL